MMRKTTLALGWVGAMLWASMAAAENWPQWRGPACNGSSPETNLPDTLDKDKTLAWSVEMPGVGAGTPIVWDDRVFVSAQDKKTQMLLAFCISRADGKVLWQKEVGQGVVTNHLNNMASPSAITDGKLVFFHFANGDLIAYDVAGTTVWQRNLQKDHGNFNYLWTYGASPLLFGGKLYVQVLHRDQPYGRRAASGPPAASYLLALDAATGKDLWKQLRATDARGESLEAYSTPIPYQGKDRTEILVIGGDYLTGHHPDTGAELFRVGGWNPTKIGHWRLVPSPMIAGDLLIGCPPKGGPMFAVKPGGSGDVTGSHVAWRSADFTSDVCVPLWYRDRLYVLDGDKKTLGIADVKTGRRVASAELGGAKVFRASPTGADGKVFCMNEAGEVWVLAADDLRLLARTTLGDGGVSRSSISVGQGMVFVRTAERLFAFVKK